MTTIKIDSDFCRNDILQKDPSQCDRWREVIGEALNCAFTAIEFIRKKHYRRISIRICGEKVLLLAPSHIAEQEALNFLHKHRHWVQKKLREQTTAPFYQPKTYAEGERFDYLGKHYYLNIAVAKQSSVMMREDQLFIFIRNSTCAVKRRQQIFRQLYAWYLQQALIHFQAKSADYAQKLGVTYRSIVVRQFKSRWGSCNTKGDIQYNWRVILAPHAIVDYLVVHELAHLRHHNHSAQFWQLVASLIPDYKAHRKWLKINGDCLRID